MLLVDNMVHSDLHPGNILVRLDPPWGTQTLCGIITDRLGLQARPLAVYLSAHHDCAAPTTRVRPIDGCRPRLCTAPQILLICS
jgi:predicted unusual protein kinase regulating ubiquinone biosynthesis (AarF/ABC1/UbiB family)